MKKIIKKVSLLVFVLLVFGITTSKAAELPKVDKNTTEVQMREWLDFKPTDRYLTNISNSVRKQNKYLYCRQHGQPISGNAKYKKKGEVSFPGSDENGYAKAYILASERGDANTTNGNRQKAWWKILDQLGSGETTPTFYYEALAYQKYKKNEKAIPGGEGIAQVTTIPTTTIDGNYLYYGPIQIQYAYEECEQNGYMFGGFDYAFYNQNGNAIGSGITLVDQNNSSGKDKGYKKNSGAYYEVRSNNFNNQAFYIKIDLANDALKNVSTINFKIRKNGVKDYNATIYNLEGNYNVSNYYGRAYCLTCQDEMEDARDVSNIGADVVNNKTQGKVYKSGDEYYTFNRMSSKYVYDLAFAEIPNKLNLAGTTVNSSTLTASMVNNSGPFYKVR